MQNKSKQLQSRDHVALTPDFLGESRHEFVAKLAYQYWLERGMPIGSPEVDWFAAERDVYEALVASGVVSRSDSNPHTFAKEIYE